MNSTEFFKKANSCLQEKKPFVLYRKPGSVENTVSQVNGLFQEDKDSYYSKDFTESGFVLAPFDLSAQKTLLIPNAHSEFLTTKISSDSDPEFSSSLQIIPEENAEELHLQLVKNCVRTIQNNALDKVVLSRKIKMLSKRNPLDIFQTLIHKYTTAFVYLWFHPQTGFWMGATPEVLLKISDENLETMALAGTKSTEQGELPQWTDKEIKEQQFVTDFIVDVLNNNVNNLKTTEVENAKAGNLWHLRTGITATLSDKNKLGAIIEALHPTPAVCGMPKQDSKEFIIQNEYYNREFYTGFLGELNFGKEDKTRLYVNLRCMKFDQKEFSIYVGGGITDKSNPQSEWQETIYKSRTMSSVL